MTAHELLLQPDSPAIEVLERELEGARRLDAASAFVTRSGIELLLPLPRPGLLRLVCRAGHGPTDPDSIAMAADELGADVRLVTGSDAARFHPKLYLVANRDRLVVLAGSGNLTAGGLRDNVEQFECLVLPASSPVALAQERRFNLLWDQGAPLEEIRSTRFWEAWREQWLRGEALRMEANKLDLDLDRHAPAAPASTPSSPTRAGWTQEDAFPVIARVIRELSSRKSDFVTRDEIAEALLNHREAAGLIEASSRARVDAHSRWMIAGNMVDWFRARFPAPWADEFRRERRRSRSPETQKTRAVWAYSPRG
jgi:hypothetical protein